MRPSQRILLKPISLAPEVTSSIHNNVSQGYVQISPNGERKFVPYTAQETGEIHGFISPQLRVYNHMKWTKTKKWKDKQAAKNSKWKRNVTYDGYNKV